MQGLRGSCTVRTYCANENLNTSALSNQCQAHSGSTLPITMFFIAEQFKCIVLRCSISVGMAVIFSVSPTLLPAHTTSGQHIRTSSVKLIWQLDSFYYFCFVHKKKSWKWFCVTVLFPLLLSTWVHQICSLEIRLINWICTQKILLNADCNRWIDSWSRNRWTNDS